MNRRAFLKFLPAGIFGSRKAAAAMMAEAEQMALAAPGGASDAAKQVFPVPPGDWARKDLLRLANPEWLTWRKSSMAATTRFDPDLAVNRSYSLATKMLIQRDRDFARMIAAEKSQLQHIIEGMMD